MKRLGLIAGLCALLVACGSGSRALYLEKPSQACLAKKGFRISHRVDFVASTATGGSFKTFLPANNVTVVFGDTESDAANLDQAYRRFHAENVGIDDVLYQDRNAVMLWHFHPSDDDRATVTGCLSS